MKNLPPEVAIQHFLHYLSNECNAQVSKIQQENVDVEKRLAMILKVYHHAITNLAYLQNVNTAAIYPAQEFYTYMIRYI